MYAKALGSSVAIVGLYLATPAIAGDLDQSVPPPVSATTSASVDFVYATRENDDSHTIIEDTITGATILNSKQFDFDWEPSVDARLNIASGNYGVGFRFFGGFEFDGSKKVTGIFRPLRRCSDLAPPALTRNTTRRWIRSNSTGPDCSATTAPCSSACAASSWTRR